MDFRKLGCFALVTGLTLASAGCGGSGAEAKKPPASSGVKTASPASGAPPAGGQRLTGAEVSIILPAGWKQVDPTSDTSEVVRTSFGLTGEMGPIVEKLLGEQKKLGVVFGIDGSVTAGFAPHVQAGCDRGGLIGASMEQLKRKQMAMEPNSQITDVQVSGRPGFKATYSSRKRAAKVQGITVRVPVPGERFCFVDIEAEQGTMPPQAEQLTASFQLA